MTPAEKLSKAKPWRREPRNKRQLRKNPWVCHVRAVREDLRLSLRDVAKGVKLSVTALWQIEMGTDPMLSTARRIAEFFGMKTGDLWTYPKAKPTKKA